jgi:hypothetical protein
MALVQVSSMLFKLNLDQQRGQAPPSQPGADVITSVNPTVNAFH